MKSLIIAEKPSVARDLARVLGKVPKNGEFFENDEWVISSAVGHLVELYMPEDMDKKLKGWRMGSLPIVPEKFDLKPIERTKSKFTELKKLMARKDVERVINACDAGREGELIFAYTYDLAKCKKPVDRLWMSSMTPQAIQSAFENLRDSQSMKSLEEAARSRSESDWLIGINGTRAVTIRLYGARGRQAATVGRVQTPTLALVVKREIEIRDFKPQTYWRILGNFEVTQGQYEGIYQKEEKGQGEHDRADRIWEKEDAEKILAEIEAQPLADVTETLKRSRQSSPRLYDLTTLQREANGRYGFPAGMTLKIAQSLYENHKVLTYPRTDSRALPNDYPGVCRNVINSLPAEYGKHTEYIVANDRINPKDKRVFNNAQVSDHFAIIPTNQNPKKLKEEEQKIYDMVVRRFLAVFHPAAEYDVTTRLSKIAEHTFKTEGKVLVKPGWLAVYERNNNSDKDIPALVDADKAPSGNYQAKLIEPELEEDTTKPPPRYSEATLLSAMEGAGKLVEDEELADAMKEKGLGTPATRAAIIDHLIKENYLVREARELSPTAKAEELLNFLFALGVDELTSPTLTGEWEYRLRQVELGKMSREEFMKGIVGLTEKIVDSAKNFEEQKESKKESRIISPSDGKPMLEGLRSYQSQDETFTLYKSVGNRKFSEKELIDLVKDRKIGPLDGFRSKAGKAFSAMIQLDDENKVKFVFDNGNGEDSENGNKKLDLKDYPEVGKSPIDGAPVYETPSAYLCATYNQEGKGFRLSRALLGKTIPKDQVVKLLDKGETDLIENFRSNRTKKLFSAQLTVDNKGKISFKFPPREPKKKKTTTKNDK